MLTKLVISLGLCGGAGGFLRSTVDVSCVTIVPVPVNVPEASLAWSVAPGIGIEPSAAAVTLIVIVPERNTLGGWGVWLGSLKKNAPIISPQLSETRFIFVTVAIAPLVSPIIVALLTA